MAALRAAVLLIFKKNHRGGGPKWPPPTGRGLSTPKLLVHRISTAARWLCPDTSSGQHSELLDDDDLGFRASQLPGYSAPITKSGTGRR